MDIGIEEVLAYLGPLIGIFIAFGKISQRQIHIDEKIDGICKEVRILANQKTRIDQMSQGIENMDKYIKENRKMLIELKEKVAVLEARK